MPENTIYVGRPTRFGNPFRIDEHGRQQAIELYEEWIQQPEQKLVLDEARQLFRGKNLACWCRPGEPCHADVLLRLVNAPPPAEGGNQ